MNTMVHLLVECPIVKKLWKGFSKWLSNLLKIDLKLNKKDIILNYYKGQYGETVNTVIIVESYIPKAVLKNKLISWRHLQKCKITAK